MGPRLAGVSIENSNVWLTPDEAEELQRLNRDFIERHRGRTADDHPAGARRVRTTRVLIPLQFQ